MKRKIITALGAIGLLLATASAHSAIQVNAWYTTTQTWNGFFWQTNTTLRCKAWTGEPATDHVFLVGFDLHCRITMPFDTFDYAFGEIADESSGFGICYC
jgi:hypothetical protein